MSNVTPDPSIPVQGDNKSPSSDVSVPTDQDNKPDVSAYEAKIVQHENTIADRDSTIANLTSELSEAKAHNYDLLTSIPANNEGIPEHRQAGSEEQSKPIKSIDDLFKD